MELDCCQDCGGILWDKGELREYLGTPRDIPDEGVSKSPGRTRSLQCPKCPGQMKETEYSFLGATMVDVCQECKAVWTDYGELAELEKIAAKAFDPKKRLQRSIAFMRQRLA